MAGYRFMIQLQQCVENRRACIVVPILRIL